ncbi:MAG: hypothetical protein Q4E91_06180 [Lachnospiraceae bacterium]|nr:hypothetical protein [Lachnospiraceae bacterium]
MKKQKRLRDMTWDDYGISKNRYKELKAFCLQYDEKKEKIQYGMNASVQDGMPKGRLSTKSPVEQQAIDNITYSKDIRMIEEAAVRANSEIWRYILRSVTEGLPYEFVEYDEELGKIPMCRADFYGTRKLFYKILDELKLEHKLNVIL